MVRGRSTPDIRAVNDIVDDRALQDAEGDEFGHEEFAAQAAQTLQAIPTPANVAIYGPWGSGKTSLAHLLDHHVDRKKCGFVRFDAFKYAEVPLRREFIRRVAIEVKLKEEKFDRGLYQEKTTTGFELKGANVETLLRIAGLIILGATTAIALVALGVALASQKAVWPEWATAMRRFVPATFASAAVVGLLIAIVKNQLSVTRRRYAPQSDEEFERLFQAIVKKAFKRHNWDRLIVYIDELDRCRFGEVASTLETLRTFLEVEGCVFVVAADRQVLERAAAARARQETPGDSRNPYYSEGSSYLDKIFQLQWHLPPLRGRSLTRFAQTLVDGRSSGVWAEVDAPHVISVLIPLHVQSPRRVKELLNAFAMTYRVAERRMKVGRLDFDVKERAAELAKLVCLQMEFPTFAADLRNEPRLPELVLSCFRKELDGRPHGVLEDVWDRVQEYAARSVELDVVMSDDKPQEDGGEPSHDEIVAAQGHLLLRYLQKTARIAGPSSDLIFLEGLGTEYGLSTSLAERLEGAAFEGRVDDALREIHNLEVADQKSALRLLGLAVREAPPGVEAQNALSVMLGVVGSLSDLELNDVVDELVDSVNTALTDEEIGEENVIGALRLALETRRPEGADLVSQTLRTAAVTEDAEIAFFVMSRVDELADEHVPRLGDILAALLVSIEWGDRLLPVAGWSHARGSALLKATREPMLRRIKEAESAAEAEDGTAPEGEGDEEPTQDFKGRVLERLEAMTEGLGAADHRPLLEGVLELALALDVQEARDLASRHLSELGRVHSPGLSHALLGHAHRRKPDSQTSWLNALDPSIVGDVANAGRLLDRSVASGWSNLVKDEGNAETYAQAASRVATSVGLPFSAQSAITKAVVASAKVGAVNQAEIDAWRLRLQVGLVLEQAGLIAAADWRDAFLESLSTFAKNPLPDNALRPSLVSVLTEDVLPMVDADLPEEPAQALDQAIEQSPWLVTGEKQLARLRIAAATGHEAPVTYEELAQALAEAPDESERSIVELAVATWLTTWNPDVAQAWEVIGRYALTELPESLRNGLSAYSESLTPGQRTSLASHAVEGFPDEAVPTEAFLDAMRWHESDTAASTDVIVDLFPKAANEELRRSVLRLWDELRLTDVVITRRLMEKVMMPLVQGAKSSRELVLQHLHLVHMLPNSDKRRLAEAIQKGCDEEEWPAVEKRLADADFMKQSGLIRRRTEHLE